MRLGGPIHAEYDDPDEWIRAVRDAGYSTTFCPVEAGADSDEIAAYRDAAEAAGVVIAEVPGFGPNPLAWDDAERREALAELKDRLSLADDVGARCVVNIAGSKSPHRWDGSHPENLTEKTFEQIVASVREIIDDVAPTEAYYTLETMPWMYPNSVESYRHLVDAVDREQFGVLDVLAVPIGPRLVDLTVAGPERPRRVIAPDGTGRRRVRNIHVESL